MIYGYKSEPTKLICANCDATLSKESEGKVQFCPKCGNPLSMEAAVQQEKMLLKGKVAILYEVLDEMEEGKDAKQTIELFISQLQDQV